MTEPYIEDDDARLSQPHPITDTAKTPPERVIGRIVAGKLQKHTTPVASVSTPKITPPPAANDNTPWPDERQHGESLEQWALRTAKAGAVGPVESPLDREFNTRRISGDLALCVEWFEAQYHKAVRTGRSGNPLKVAPETLIGSEVNADGYLACRYIAFRLGHLYQTLLGAVIEDKPMADLCGDEFMTSDGRLPKDAARIGRRRVVDALTLLNNAYEAWLDMVESKAQPRSYAVGPLLSHTPSNRLSAANENARHKGKMHLSGAA